MSKPTKDALVRLYARGIADLTRDNIALVKQNAILRERLEAIASIADHRLDPEVEGIKRACKKLVVDAHKLFADVP